MSQLRIAMIGQRGVPATYGGIERHVEELGAHLVGLGHEVTVYCRTNYVGTRPSEHRGMRLRYLPTVGRKHLDAIAHSAVSTVDALRGHYDIVHYHALGPGALAVLPRFVSGARVVQTVHGLDNERAKWGRAARGFLSAAAWTSAHVPDATITVSDALAKVYRSRYGCLATAIPNGVVAPPERRDGLVAGHGLSRGSYALFVGRLVPEKSPDLLIRAFRAVPGDDRRLVLVGGSSYTDGFNAQLARLSEADPRVMMLGYVYGDDLARLYADAAVFVLPSELEGMPLTLLEAAAHGTPVVASDIPPHLEVIGTDGPGHRLFRTRDEQDLVAAIGRATADPALERQGALQLRTRVLDRYRWDVAAARTEALYVRLLSGDRGGNRRAASASADAVRDRGPARRLRRRQGELRPRQRV